MWRDEANLLDMLLAARHASAFTGDVTWEQFEGAPLHQHAIAKALENIGEAAARVTEEFRAAHPQIPWRRIVALRHRIAHGYFSLDLLRVWEIATTEVPALIDALEPLVSDEEN